MKIEETSIEGLFILKDLPSFKDIRGKLFKPYSSSFFANEKNLNSEMKELWFTFSKRDVIRGMHLQIGEFACEKIVSVIKGKLQDVIIDLRKDSKTFRQVFELVIEEQDNKAIYIPKGCAHGYKVLEDDTITMYIATDVHSQKDDVGIRWNSFEYDWKIEYPIISEKDSLLPTLEEFLNTYSV
ncbi:MAG TPA: dTDP-4-dehydrorhamnose 3,5-epimerase family protein [Defluviitoga tunisiensis]|nr:dTDP-4-dehydrorhamnose 3,5-epimerase family protein [Defluviitoga tunisiensis]HPP10988.1 dTDP-4-dehydrorhamnose 3,5-epimerase family protein [Defluviitoga tunisiensis]